MYIGRPNPQSYLRRPLSIYASKAGTLDGRRETGDAKAVLVPYYGQPPRNTRFVDKWTPASAGVTNVYREA
jgi:hypothetical protein